MSAMLRYLFLACILAPVAAATHAAERCDGEEVLLRAAEAYRRLDALSDTAQYTIQVPGAAVHHETTDFGFDRKHKVVLRMPGLYRIAVMGDRLYITTDPEIPMARQLERPAGSDLQVAVDTAFEGHGPPLVPVPILLRATVRGDSEAQAFRLRLLHQIRITGCHTVINSRGGPVNEVTLEADNGTVRAQFQSESGLLARYRVEIATGSGNAPVIADVSFDPHPNVRPAHAPAGTDEKSQQVRHFAELTGATDELPVDPLKQSGLRTINGQPIALDAYAGDIVVLEFWATWCAPCRLTLPAIERVATWSQDGHLPVHVVLINTAEEFPTIAMARPELERFLNWAKVSLPTAVDLDGSFHRRFGGGLPLTIVISREGQVVGRYGGYHATIERALREQISSLLDGTKSGDLDLSPAARRSPAGAELKSVGQ